MLSIVLLAMVLCLPVLLVLRNGQSKKRGCGRGCATCGNRHLCHPGQYQPPEKTDTGP